MKVLGLLGITFPTSDYNSTLQWINQNLGYDYKVLSFFVKQGEFDSKIVVLVNKNGGLPLFLKQNLAAETYLFNDFTIGDLGPLAFKIRVSDIQHIYLVLKTKKLTFTSKILETYDGRFLFWVKDAFNNSYIFEELSSSSEDSLTKDIYGIDSVVVGVNDIDKAVKFYGELGYKVKLELDYTDDLKPIMSGKKILKRVILEREISSHIFQEFIGTTYLDLVQAEENKSAKVSNFGLNFLVSELDKIDKEFEFEVIDNKEITCLYSNFYDQFTGQEHKIMDIVRVRFYDVLDWNLKYPKLKLSDKKKLRFILNNALEKI